MAEEKEKAAVSAEAQVLEQPSLVEEIIQATKLKPTDENYSMMRKGLEEKSCLLSRMKSCSVKNHTLLQSTLRQ